MLCPKCGNNLDEGAMFCSRCGERIGIEPTPQNPEAMPKKKKSKVLPITLAVIAIIIALGIYGASGSDGHTDVTIVPGSSSSSDTQSESINSSEADEPEPESSISESAPEKTELTADEGKIFIEDWLDENALDVGEVGVTIGEPGTIDGMDCEFYVLTIDDGDPFVGVYMDKDTGDLYLAGEEELIPLDKWYTEIWLAYSGRMEIGNREYQPAEQTSYYSDDKFEITDVPTVSTDAIGVYHIEGIMANNTDTTFSVVLIEFSIYDAAGNQVDTGRDTITNFKPGNTWKFDAIVYAKDADRFEVAEITAK